MLKDIVMILSGIIGGYLFIKIRQKIINQTKGIVEEKFNVSKFVSGMTNVTSSTGWAKDIYSLFNLRKLIIVGVILSVIFGYGYWKGRTNAPVNLNLQGKEVTIKLNEHYLKIEKSGDTKVLDKDGKVLKVIKVKDIPELSKALRPYGFILEPVVVLGSGIGLNGIEGEAGLGLSWIKYFKYNLDSFLTNKGIYPLGISYKITDNSGAGLGVGKGWQGDNRIIMYYKWRF